MEKTFRKVKYKTLSPLHIGDGNALGPLEYFVHNGRVCFYGLDDLRRLFDREQMEDFINYAVSEESPSLVGFFKTYANAEQILRVASGRASYSFRIWGGETPGKVWTFIKCRNQPYIPGSEIKGSLRTAILRKINLHDSLSGNIVKEISALKQKFSRNPERRELTRELDRLEEGISGRALRLSQRNDAKFDLMKFILVSDAYSKTVEPVVANIEIKNSSRPRGEFHEIIPQGTEFQSEIGFIRGRQFDEFAGRFKADDGKKSFFSKLEHILRACYEMSNGILEEELRFYRRLKVNSAINQLEEIKKANDESSPVIRVGKHQGFMSITLAELIKKLGEGVYGNYVELLRSTGKRIYPDNFPKTRKVLINPAKEELTLGWIKIEVE